MVMQPPYQVKGKDLCSFPSQLVQAQWKQLDCGYTSQKSTTYDCSKDRYSLKLVYEHSRVKIEPESRYINANHLLNKKYIACQAPLPHTFAQFYDMVWQEDVSVIVMLTKLEESHRCKAHRYWPTNCYPKKFFGDQDLQDNRWCVELLEKDAFDDDILIRKLSITLLETNETRIITQIQYLGWPDHGCPRDFRSVAALLVAVEVNNKGGPLLVHCSAGIGRTGTFITIRHELQRAIESFQFNYLPYFECSSVDEQLNAVQNFLRNHNFQIGSTVQRLREDRKMMVQRQEQLQFCYDFFSFILCPTEGGIYDIEEYILPFFFPPSEDDQMDLINTQMNSPLFSFP